jgi:hypothetical protein
MSDEICKLQKIVAKTFRKAKRWYLSYVLWQIIVLLFAVASIFVEIDPKVSAVIAFIIVLSAEALRWRSDNWKSQGELAKRKLEMADGLGIPVGGPYIADWLAAKPRGFLQDLTAREIQGSEFDSVQPVGPRRLVENTQESAWWSKHLSGRMVFYLSIVLAFTTVCAFVALTASIARLKNPTDPQAASTVQYVAGVVCSALAFIVSINVVRLLAEFCAFAADAKEVLRQCGELLKESAIDERDALWALHDYQTSRSVAPLIPTFVWKIHGAHLREQWANFRPRLEPAVNAAKG